MATSKPNKANKQQQQEEKITSVEVIKEVPLETIIDQALTKVNVTKKVLTAMKNKYLVAAEGDNMVLKDELILRNDTDKERYLIVKEERKGVRKIGIITEDLCKKGRQHAIDEQKAWLAKEKEILGEVDIVQLQMDAQIKRYEDEVERLRVLEEQRKDDQLSTRQTELIKMGAVIANGCMNINDLAIEISNIREADDDIYNDTILPLFKMQYEKNEQARVAKEKSENEAAELFKKQQEELQEQQKKMQQMM